MVDVGTWQAFHSSILAIKLTFSVLRQEIESLHVFSYLVKFLHFSTSRAKTSFSLTIFFISLNEQVFLAFQDFILLDNGFYQFIDFLLLFYGKGCKKRRQIIILFTRATLIIGSSIFGGVSRVYLLHFSLLGHEALVADVGEEKTFVDGDVGGVLVGGVGGAVIGVPLPSYVRLATLFLVVVPFLLQLLISFLVVVTVTITCIWTFRNIMTKLTTPVANPLGARFVLLPLPLLEDLPEVLNNKSYLLVVKLGGINWEPIDWCMLFLLFFRCLECNGLHLGCGGGSLLQVDNVFGVFDHKFKAHKLANHLLGRHSTGCTSGVEVVPCSKLAMCLESLIISPKLTNLPITYSRDICLYLGSPRIN
jgi:hypothetical protein